MITSQQEVRHPGAKWGEDNDAQCDECEENPVAWLHKTLFGILGYCEDCHASGSGAGL